MTNHYITDGGSDPSQSERPKTLRYGVPQQESHSEAVVKAVAAVTDTSVLDLDPLYDVLDPESLDQSFERQRSDADNMEITFVFNGCDVTVSRGEVTVRAIDESL